MISRNSSRSHRLAIVAAFAAFFVFTMSVLAQAPAAPGAAAPPLSAEELDKLVGRIALYPDDLIAIILPASTNPLQIVQADRFLDKRKANPKLPIDETWDDAVKSLLNYPDVIKIMSNDIDWTASLGEAVVADQAAVLAAVQTFRRKTQAAGNLKSDNKQNVTVENETIRIAPADPQVIYVPQYNPSTVVVSGGYYSPAYYPSPYPVYYYPYPPGAAFATGLVWGAAIGAAWNGGHYTTHYGGGTANITINRNTNVSGVNRPSGASTQLSATTTQWRANKQPGQVRSTARPASTRVGYASSSGYAGATRTPAAPQAVRTPGSSAATRQTTTRTTTTRQSVGGSSGFGGGSAFSGSSSGYQSRLDSSRGAASRSSMSSRSTMSGAGVRQAPRAGGGGMRGGRR